MFVKAIDAAAWPHGAGIYRAEIAAAASLPPSVPAPPLLGAREIDGWVVLAFAHVDGREPELPWRPDDLARMLDALGCVAATPAPPALGFDHPRLGGFATVAGDPARMAMLRTLAPWAAGGIDRLVRLDAIGRVAARGRSLVHFDAYPHNVLLTADRVVLVDWPHARAGSPVIDVVAALTSVIAHGGDPEPALAGRPFEPAIVTAVLAAQAGFLLAGGLAPEVPPGLAPIIEAKRALGLAGLEWLRRRL